MVNQRSDRKFPGKHLLLAAVIGVLLAGVLIAGEVARAVVTVDLFEAYAYDGEVQLIWSTASELDNAGFFVLRSLTQDGIYERVSEFVQGTGDTSGDVYDWTDVDVVDGTTYWYKLEAIDNDNNSDYYGPIWATPGVEPTDEPTGPTPTRTGTSTLTTTPTGSQEATASLTPSSTATVSSSQASATPSRTATQSSYPAAATRTPTRAAPAAPTATSGSGATQPVLPTALPGTEQPDGQTGVLETTPGLGNSTQGILGTLVPLPEIEFQYPQQPAALAAAGPESEETLARSAPTAESTPDGNWWTLQRGVVIGVLVLIWGLLGIWFVIAMRRLT